MGGDRRVSGWGSGAGGYVCRLSCVSLRCVCHPTPSCLSTPTNQNRASSTEATTELADGDDDGSHDDAAAAAAGFTTLKDKMAALDAARARVHAVQDAGAARRAEVGFMGWDWMGCVCV